MTFKPVIGGVEADSCAIWVICITVGIQPLGTSSCSGNTADRLD